MADLEFNFRWVSNAQSLDAKNEDVRAATAGFARMVVEEVALATAKQTYQKARTSLVSGLKRVVMGEIGRMARLIGSTLALSANRTGPEGSMSIKEGMSATAERLGLNMTYNREDAGIVWPKRAKSYMAWKKRHRMSPDWWHAKGKLTNDLKKAEIYTRAFGPVVVTFHPPKAARDARGRFTRGTGALTTKGIDPLTHDRQLANGGVNIVQSGRKGPANGEYEVGRLEVATFGRITPTMLPSLADLRNNSAVMDESIPLSGVGISGLLPANKTDRVRQKLVGRSGKQRYAIDPYVSYFLTRAIPNAVWRRTEQLVGNRIVG